MGKSDYEAMTVLELRDALSARGLTVYGSKAELVDRLVESDDVGQTVEDSEDAVGVEAKARESGRREIHAGGHVILADFEPDTPAPIVTCSVCGVPDGDCVHSAKGDDVNPGWVAEEGA